MAGNRYSSGSHTRSASCRLSDGSLSSTTSMSTAGSIMTPSTGSSTPGRQPSSAGPEYGSPADGYHTAEEMMMATPSNRESLPAPSGVSLPGGTSVSYPQQAFDSSQWGPGQGVDAMTDSGQVRYATPGPGGMGHGRSDSSDVMMASMYVFPPSPPRPPGARSSTAVGETKSKKTKTKKGTGEKKGREHTRTGSASSGSYSQAGSHASHRSFSSAGPYPPAGPHQPYPSAGFDVSTQSYPSPGYNAPTLSYHLAGPDTRGMSGTAGMSYAPAESHHPAMPYPPAEANTPGMYGIPVAPSTPGMSDTTMPWPSSSRSIALAHGAPWPGSYTQDDFNHLAFLNSSGPPAPYHYPGTLAEHDCQDNGNSPGQDMDEQEYDMMEDARNVKDFENVMDGGHSKYHGRRK